MYFQRGVDNAAFQNCTGPTREYYITITRTQVSPQPAPSVLMGEERMLALGDTVEKVNITFTLFPGENAAASRFSLGVALLVAVTSVLAF